jgi:hypothetical protein
MKSDCLLVLELYDDLIRLDVGIEHRVVFLGPPDVLVLLHEDAKVNILWYLGSSSWCRSVW